MKMKRLFAAIFALIGIFTAATAIYIAANFTDRDPQLLTPPTVARSKVVMMMNAVCAGDYEQASQTILGTPSLGVDRDAADETGAMIWEAFRESLSFELVGECYPTADGLAQNVLLTGLDIESVTVNLKDRSQTLLEQRVLDAEDISEIYDENNEYCEAFVLEVLHDAVQQALEEDATERTVELTVKLCYHDGSWWVVADNALLDAISGGILY